MIFRNFQLFAKYFALTTGKNMAFMIENGERYLNKPERAKVFK